MKRYVSIGTTVSLATMAVIAASAAIVTAALSRHERESLILAKERAAQAVTGLLARSLSASVIFDDTTGVEEALAHLSADPDILDASVWRLDRDTGRVQACLASLHLGCSKQQQPDFATRRLPDRMLLGVQILGPAHEALAVARVEVSLARENAAAAALARRIALVSSLLGCILCALLLLVLQRVVLRRLHALVANVRAFEAGEKVAVDVGANDEVGRLAEAFRSMATTIAERGGRIEANAQALSEANQKLQGSLSELREAQRALVEASRKAGMADVATAVLHNVGNVLNSVNVSAGVVSEWVQNSKIAGLAKATQLLRQNEAGLGSFFTQDERGKRLLPYLEKLAETVAAEQKNTVLELSGLQKNIDHIKTVVATQQSHAKSGGVIESLQLDELAEESLRLSLLASEPNGISIVRDFCSAEPVATDRHKVSQILLNLLSNARHAILEANPSEKRITVRTRVAGDRFTIAVEDTGCGIAPESLARIFNHGFTTKKDGHGFGLHSSACAATELLGSLNVESPGRGSGAVFTLSLPLQQEAR